MIGEFGDVLNQFGSVTAEFDNVCNQSGNVRVRTGSYALGMGNFDEGFRRDDFFDEVGAHRTHLPSTSRAQLATTNPILSAMLCTERSTPTSLHSVNFPQLVQMKKIVACLCTRDAVAT